MAARGYQDLIAWQKAMELAVQAYRLSGLLPGEEKYCLCQQIRRAASSIPANIAEGQGRGPGGDFTRFLRVARGSLFETETHVMLAHRLAMLDAPTFENFLQHSAEVGRLLNGLLNSVTSSD